MLLISVQDHLLRPCIEEIQAVDAEANGDGIPAAGIGAGINAVHAVSLFAVGALPPSFFNFPHGRRL